MAKLYKRKGSTEHYIKHRFRKNETQILWTTYQVYDQVLHFLASRNIEDGDPIPNKLFYALLENELIYTNKTGPGISEGRAISAVAKHALKRLEDVSKSAHSDEAPISALIDEDQDVIEVAGLFRGRIPTGVWQRPNLTPIPAATEFTLPFEFFPHSVVRHYGIYDSIDHYYKLLKNYWGFFELSGLASYTNNSEFNQVLGRLIALMYVIREIGNEAYEDGFQSDDEMTDWFQNMPFIQAELLERFGEDEDLVHLICESEIDSVHSGLINYYNDREGDDCDFEDAIMKDMRLHLTIGNDIECHYGDNQSFQETGFTGSEWQASNFISNGFSW